MISRPRTTAAVVTGPAAPRIPLRIARAGMYSEVNCFLFYLELDGMALLYIIPRAWQNYSSNPRTAVLVSPARQCEQGVLVETRARRQILHLLTR